MYLLLGLMFWSIFSLFVCVLFAFVYLCMRACGLEDNIFHIKRNVWVGRGECVCDAL